ncbi:hypothetical protein, partial [Vibrio parahaemolyticus]|uniref:hypothetical protein n=1 Tax=Vibrio parahaemolyticus TaxID=670 RepID=UPI002110F1C5
TGAFNGTAFIVPEAGTYAVTGGIFLASSLAIGVLTPETPLSLDVLITPAGGAPTIVRSASAPVIDIAGLITATLGSTSLVVTGQFNLGV